MAFDLINYLYDQTLQQQKGILAESTKDQKETYIKHIISTQIYVLMQGFKNNDYNAYQVITDQDSQKLELKSHELLSNTDGAQLFFKNILDKLNDTNKKISHVILSELAQLNENAHLGQNGLEELITNQHEWIYPNVEEWFYQMTNRPYINLTKSNKKNSLDSTQINKEFSKILHQKSAEFTENDHINTITLEEKTKQISNFYHFLNPLIALIILIFLLNIIL